MCAMAGSSSPSPLAHTAPVLPTGRATCQGCKTVTWLSRPVASPYFVFEDAFLHLNSCSWKLPQKTSPSFIGRWRTGVAKRTQQLRAGIGDVVETAKLACLCVQDIQVLTWFLQQWAWTSTLFILELFVATFKTFLCVCVYKCAYAMAHVDSESQDSFQGSVLSFHIGSRTQTQVRLIWQALLSTGLCCMYGSFGTFSLPEPAQILNRYLQDKHLKLGPRLTCKL